ncbi:hypothetical protein E2P81_ATG11876 [Venturia nashicola]|uniref:C2H2-type domain-containing protein n=1 Tax=Venturia nashicola TaxID=86259 RepID=A0A4Z1NY51_9PEZI|nr:hypothetical protein E6O75_ATG11567 [Venturia nashicola]TLD24540.1 hypothetical protein E2P81_ATG11876 [Venturia nashicola]
MSTVDTSPMRQAALPQRHRDDASHAFVPTTSGPGMADASFSNFFDLNPNDMNQFNGSSPFQNLSPYQQDYFIQNTLNHPSNLVPLNGTQSPPTGNGQFSPSNVMSEGSMNGMSAYSTPGAEESYVDLEFSRSPIMTNSSRLNTNNFETSPIPNSQHLGFQNQSSSMTYSNISSLAPHHASPMSSHRSSPAPQQIMGYAQANNSTFYGSHQTTTLALQSFPQLSDHVVPRSAPEYPSSFSAVQSSTNTNPQLVITAEDCQDVCGGSRHCLSNRNQGGKRLNTHLSPYTDHDCSDEELEEEPQPRSTVAVERSSDGSWLQQTGSGQAGVKPEDREEMNIQDLPTLDEIEEDRQLLEKNAEVAEWLSHSNIESDARRSRKRKADGRRRAKSTNDTPFGIASAAGLGVYSPVPGPGLTVQEPSDADEDEASGSESDADLAANARSGDVDDGYLPSLNEIETEPTWLEPEQSSSSEEPTKCQGITSNLAIARFHQRAKEIDNASLAATLGSRRRNSESDIDSSVNAVGISKLLLSPTQTKPGSKGVRRKGSFLNNILPSRNNSNKLKRKTSQTADAANPAQVSKEAPSPSPLTPPRRMGSFGRPKSPRIDTNLASNNNEARSPGAVVTAASSILQHGRQIWRSRSRSDLNPKTPKSLGLAALMTQHGGPPVPTLASPMTLPHEDDHASGGREGDEDSGDDEATGLDGVTMDLAVRTDVPIVPTKDGFKYHASQLNPRLESFLLERVTQEQMRRYERLVKIKEEHAQAVARRCCSSKTFCFASGGQAKELPPRPGNKDPNTPLVGFQILGPGVTEESLDNSGESQTVAAQFPSGVPAPPVQRLPAEFECHLCFKAKKFYKPSDWTKHVHEDVQPFTCTFINCNEPKSFKRKADWVRHENERHRQLEYWTCNLGDCTHTCFRKDNFVQHLVREHKVPEPRLRTGRNNNRPSPSTPVNPMSGWQNGLGVPHMGEDDIWALVERCHHESTKQPQDEPCKFCGNVCTTWKKLTVHLAKHMEQISMPLLGLVDLKRVSAASDHNVVQQQYQQHNGHPTKAFSQLPTLLFDEPDNMAIHMSSNDMTANNMHSYPPFQHMQHLGFSSNSPNLGNSPYPPQTAPVRSRASSFGAASDYSASRQGTTYPPTNFTTQGMQSSNPAYHGPQVFFQSGSNYVTESVSNAYLTPTSGTPVSMGYSPDCSVTDLQQTYQQY